MPLPSDPLGLSRSGWEAAAEELNLPRYRGRQVFDALHRRGRRAWREVTELPGSLRERFERETPIGLPEIARRQDSADGSRKYGLRLSDGALVEAVFMPVDVSQARVNEFEDARAEAQSRRPEPEIAAVSSKPGAGATKAPSATTPCASLRRRDARSTAPSA
jgi:hypothetical protein